jgi:hypothetical protein
MFFLFYVAREFMFMGFFSILFSLNQVQRTWAGGLVHKWAAVGLGMDVVVKKHHME